MESNSDLFGIKFEGGSRKRWILIPHVSEITAVPISHSRTNDATEGQLAWAMQSHRLWMDSKLYFLMNDRQKINR
jgi:hypothetical protein